jgi:hypothetical protein
MPRRETLRTGPVCIESTSAGAVRNLTSSPAPPAMMYKSYNTLGRSVLRSRSARFGLVPIRDD